MSKNLVRKQFSRKEVTNNICLRIQKKSKNKSSCGEKGKGDKIRVRPSFCNTYLFFSQSECWTTTTQNLIIFKKTELIFEICFSAFFFFTYKFQDMNVKLTQQLFILFTCFLQRFCLLCFYTPESKNGGKADFSKVWA